MRKKSYQILAACVGLTVVVLSVLAFFIISIDRADDTFYDGLGRLLVPVPAWTKFIIQDDRWAGLGWRLIDIIWFWGGLILAFWLFGRGEESGTDHMPEETSSPSQQQDREREAEILIESLALMGSEEYAEMTEGDRKSAVDDVRRKHGLDVGL